MMILVLLVLTVVASAIAAGAATYFLNISKERLLFVGRKSEELYCTLEALDGDLSAFYRKRYALVGEMGQGAGQVAGQVTGIEHLHRANAYFATVRMLIGLYFPTLAPDLARVSAAALTARHGLESLEEAAQSGRAPRIEALDAAVCDLKDAIDALKAAALTTGRRANERSFFALSWRSPQLTQERRVLQVQA
jgi:hypothetical protein